jgi:hypothetical protein
MVVVRWQVSESGHVQECPGLLEAFEFAIAQGIQNKFTLQENGGEIINGPELIIGFREMFAPIEGGDV